MFDDKEKIAQIEEMFELNQDDTVIMQNREFPLILGSITKNVVVSMTDVSMFNLFLDEKEIKKNLGKTGERAMQTMLTIS